MCPKMEAFLNSSIAFGSQTKPSLHKITPHKNLPSSSETSLLNVLVYANCFPTRPPAGAQLHPGARPPAAGRQHAGQLEAQRPQQRQHQRCQRRQQQQCQHGQLRQLLRRLHRLQLCRR